MKYDDVRLDAIHEQLISLEVDIGASYRNPSASPTAALETVRSARDAFTELRRELKLRTLAYNGMRGLLVGRRSDVKYLRSMLEEVRNALERNLEDGETALEITKEALEAHGGEA